MFNETINNYISEKEQEFWDIVKDYKLKNYSFNINYDKYNYKNIETVHFIIYQYVGGAHDERFDEIFYYDKQNKKQLMISDLLIINDSFYEKLSLLAREKLTSQKDLLFQGEMLEDGLKGVPTNYKYLIFTDEGLKIVFPPYQIGPWSSGEIDVIIPYQSISEYLKFIY